MEENPYQSPKSEPEFEERPKKPPERHQFAALQGLGTFFGLVISQAMIMEFVWGQLDTGPSRAERRLLPLVYALIACPVVMLIAWWTWKVPESKWARVTAILLGLSPLALIMLFILYGLVWLLLH